MYQKTNLIVLNQYTKSPKTIYMDTKVCQCGTFSGIYFKITINYFLKKYKFHELKSILDLFYFDDAFLIGNYTQNKNKLELLFNIFYDIGISINKNKTKIFVGDYGIQQKWMLDYNLNMNYNMEILGVHIGDKNYMEQIWDKQFNQLKSLWSKLRNIENKHIHFCYFKHCAGLSKINHMLKTCEIINSENDFDVILENMDKEFQL